MKKNSTLIKRVKRKKNPRDREEERLKEKRKSRILPPSNHKRMYRYSRQSRTSRKKRSRPRPMPKRSRKLSRSLRRGTRRSILRKRRITRIS